MEDLQTKEVKKHQKNTAIPDDNGSDYSNISSKKQTGNPSLGDSYSVNHAPKLATSLLQSFCRENKPFVLPVQIGETRSPSLIVPASSISKVQDQHLNSQLPPPLCSYQFANIQKSVLLENLLPNQSETLVYNTDVPVFQSSGIATCLPDLISSLSNYASSEYQMTGPDKTIPSNIMPSETVHPISAPLTSLIPPATLLVPYPFVVPLPVPFPIPIPILTHSPQSLNFRTGGSTNEKSTLTSPANCTNSLFLQTPSEFQDGVLDLSFKATQTKQELTLSASPNSALDLSVVNSNTRHQNHWGKDMNGQNTQCNWTIHEVNGNNIRRSKYKDYNGGIVSPMENVHAPFSDKRRDFSQNSMISSPIKPHRGQNTVPQDCSRKEFRIHPVCSEPHRQILSNRSVHFKRGGSQNMYGNTRPNKKPHMTSFLSMK